MRQHVYILCASHSDYTQGDEIHGVYTSERKAKAAARELADLDRIVWTTRGSTKTHRRFSLFSYGPALEDAAPWQYTIYVIRPE